MAPRTGPRVKVISPNSGTVTTLSRSVSASSSVHSSARVSPSSLFLRRHNSRYSYDAQEEEQPPAQPQQQSKRSMLPAESVTPPQSGRAVLRALGLNTEAVGRSAEGKKSRDTASYYSSIHNPTHPENERYTQSHISSHNNSSRATAHTSASMSDAGRANRGGVPVKSSAAPSSLPNFFEEADQRRAAHTAPSRHTPMTFSNSRSTSRSHAAPTERHRSRAENEEAIGRAKAALEHAGDSVLRRPFHNNKSNSNNSNSSVNASLQDKSTSTLLGVSAAAHAGQPVKNATNSSASHPSYSINSSSNNMSSGYGASRHRGLRLPPSIPITGADADDDEEEVDGSDYDGRSDVSGSDRQKRPRTWSVDAAENAAAVLARRRQGTHIAAPAAYTNGNASSFQLSTTAEKSTAAPARVCPGMFAGVSAVTVDPRLFDGWEANTRHERADNAAPSSRDAPPPPHHQQQHQQQRYCVRPLWSLVGTFKTALGGLVCVDFQQDCLRWFQRNPKGGQQCIKVPLSHIVDVFSTRVVQEDENIEERQFTVVVRTSTRPSQVVFGFASVTEANHMRNVLKRQQ